MNRTEYWAAYYTAHKERITAKHAAYRATHKVEDAAIDAAYRATHREESAAYAAAYRESHRLEITAGQEAYYATHKAEKNAYAAAYYKSHQVETVARMSTYRATHKEQIAAYHVAYNAARPEVILFYKQMRRSRKNNAPGTSYITLDLLEQRWEYYGRRCYLCGVPATATDHVKPLAKGGAAWPCNLRPICKTCNSIKSAKWPYDFEAHRARMTTLTTVTTFFTAEDKARIKEAAFQEGAPSFAEYKRVEDAVLCEMREVLAGMVKTG